jgi:heterodisulfide reductase subunit A-like polyferredoxin
MLVRGFSTAAQAVVRLSEHSLLQKGKGLSFYQPDPVPEEPGRIGVFVCRCNDSLGWLPEMDGIVEELQQLPHVVHAGVLLSACIPDGTASILRTVRDKGITRIVLGSCVCCPLDFVCSACTDQRSRLKHDLFTATGISRAMAATCNIRGEALSLLPRDPGQALLLFEGLLHRSVRNAGRLHPFPSPVRNYSFISAVIGDSVAAQHSAGTLAEAGMDVFWFADPGQVPTTLQNHPNIHWFSDATVTEIGGTLGDFTLMAKTVEGLQQIHVGTVILGEKSRKRIGYIHQAGLPARTIACGIQQAGTTGIPFFYPGMTSISGLFVADPPGIPVSTRQKGEAAAMLVAAALPRGPRKSKGYTVTIRTELCRGCGRCVDVCPYHAVSLHPRGNGGWAASVDAGFCKGCGNCISVCPSNAADSPYRSQLFFEQTLEEILCQPN